jgi:hypothetical protein
MGIFDVQAKVVSIYKADTTDHKRKVKELRGIEKKAARARLDEIEKENEKLQKKITTIGKVATAVGALGAAYLAAKESFATFAEDAQLRAAAAGSDIEGLRKVTRGLITEQKLLELSAANMNTQWKLSNEEMAVAGEFMLALRKQGNDMATVFEQVKRAIVEADVEGLQKFGITIKESKGSIEAHNAIVERMREEVAKMGGDLGIAGDDVSRAGVKMEDAFRRVKVAAGELVRILTPLIEALATAASGIAALFSGDFGAGVGDALFGGGTAGDIAALEKDIAFQQSLPGGGSSSLIKQKQAEIDRLKRAAFKGGKKSGGARSGRGLLDLGNLRVKKPGSGAPAPAKKKRGGGKRKGSFIDGIRVDSALSGGLGPEATAELLASLGVEDESGLSLSGVLGGAGDLLSAARGGISSTLAGAAGEVRGGQDSFLSNVFGTPEQFNSEVQIYAQGFETLTGAVTAGFDAWITGAMSVGAAIKSAIAESLRATATEMLGQALRHGAFALGMLAFSRPDAAAKHGKAAAAFGAGAIALGAAAKGLGAGGGGSGGAGGGGGLGSPPSSAGVGGSAGGATGQHVTVFIGNDFGSDDRRQRNERLRRNLRDAGVTEPSSQVSFA